MKRVIYKYILKVVDVQEFYLPIGSEILTIQTQGEDVCLWALLNPEYEEKQMVCIEMFGTGHPIDYSSQNSRRYISTFQLEGGSLVFHAFEYTGI